MARKFVKAIGLHNIFNAISDTSLDLTSIKQSVQSKVNETTIVFLTALDDASYGYPDDTKYIWTMNTLYPTNDASIVTLEDVSNYGIDGVASSLDVYNKIIEDEEITSLAINSIADSLGLDSSFLYKWSSSTGIPEDLSYKDAIEYVCMNSGAQINDSSINLTETWSSDKIDNEIYESLDEKEKYLTFEAVTDGYIGWYNNPDNELQPTIQYSIDRKTWTNFE